MEGSGGRRRAVPSGTGQEGERGKRKGNRRCCVWWVNGNRVGLGEDAMETRGVRVGAFAGTRVGVGG